jgi:hypothetical protein
MMIARIPARQQLGGSENKKPAEAGQGSSLHWGGGIVPSCDITLPGVGLRKTAYRNGNAVSLHW